jgi:NADH-quinone oxidoreductase subunit J
VSGNVVPNLVFFGLAAVIIIPALLMVFSRNLVHSALFLLISFLGTAGVYLMLNAEFVALLQVIIYGGAITVIILFAVMLTGIRVTTGEQTVTLEKAVVAVAVTLLLLLSWTTLALTDWSVSEKVAAPRNIDFFGRLLFTKYVFPFELASVVLLVALIGAILLASTAKDKAGRKN